MKCRAPNGASALAVTALLGVWGSGCGPTVGELESRVLPQPKRPAPGVGLPDAYPRSQFSDPRLGDLAREFTAWAMEQRCAETDGGALYSRVEVLPAARTVLPYGVGAYQQEPRLPAILTIGPGWAMQTPEQKEAAAAMAFSELSRRLEGLKLDPPLRPTLTIQTPSGLELGWINNLIAGRRNIHGDEQ